MTAVHSAEQSTEPAQAARLEEALEPGPSIMTSSSGRRKAEEIAMPSTTTSEFEVMDEFDQVDESDEEALLAIARRLKRARR